MPRFSFYSLALCTSFVVYYLVSQVIFNQVFATSKTVIDEAFHIPQGLLYCNFSFDTWDDKITTLPGLYLISAALLGPFNACTIYWLRYVNLLASIVNLLLIYTYFTLFTEQNRWSNLLSSVNLAILPPLYFFSHVYYTDVLSITFVLLHIILSKNEQHILSSISGMISVVMRQPNIVWVIMVLGNYVTKELEARYVSKRFKKVSSSDLGKRLTIVKMIWDDLKSGYFFRRFPLKVWLDIGCYLAILMSFALFVTLNGSVVVGDKTAHMVSFHLPQLFYFTLFCLIFGWPHFISCGMDFLQFAYKRKLLSIGIIMGFTAIVHFNTLVHPYLVADNRHYTFYIWNRFYGSHPWFRYLMIPMYYFGFYAVFSKMHSAKRNSRISIIVLGVCVMFVLALQKLIEIRYFLIPYILVRINLKRVKMWHLILEFLFFCMLNAVTFQIFFTKEIYWIDFDYVQRLIW